MTTEVKQWTPGQQRENMSRLLGILEPVAEGTVGKRWEALWAAICQEFPSLASRAVGIAESEQGSPPISVISIFKKYRSQSASLLSSNERELVAQMLERYTGTPRILLAGSAKEDLSKYLTRVLTKGLDLSRRGVEINLS